MELSSNIIVVSSRNQPFSVALGGNTPLPSLGKKRIAWPGLNHGTFHRFHGKLIYIIYINCGNDFPLDGSDCKNSGK